MFFGLSPPPLASSIKHCGYLSQQAAALPLIKLKVTPATEIFSQATAVTFWSLHTTQAAERIVISTENLPPNVQCNIF